MGKSTVTRMKKALFSLLMGRNGIFVMIIVAYAIAFGYLATLYANALPIDAVINIAGLLLTVEGILLGLGGQRKTSVIAPSIALTAILYSLFVITLGEIGKNSKDSPIAQSGVASLLIFTILLFSCTVIAYAIEITRS